MNLSWSDKNLDLFHPHKDGVYSFLYVLFLFVGISGGFLMLWARRGSIQMGLMDIAMFVVYILAQYVLAYIATVSVHFVFHWATVLTKIYRNTEKSRLVVFGKLLESKLFGRDTHVIYLDVDGTSVNMEIMSSRQYGAIKGSIKDFVGGTVTDVTELSFVSPSYYDRGCALCSNKSEADHIIELRDHIDNEFVAHGSCEECIGSLVDDVADDLESDQISEVVSETI